MRAIGKKKNFFLTINLRAAQDLDADPGVDDKAKGAGIGGNSRPALLQHYYKSAAAVAATAVAATVAAACAASRTVLAECGKASLRPLTEKSIREKKNFLSQSLVVVAME